MAETLSLIHERVDDIPLLIGLMQQLKLPEILDRLIGNHGHHQGASNGTLAIVWLAYILSEGDHRKSHVQEWAERHRYTLERLLGFFFRKVEFNDDRLGILLHRLSKPEVWEAIEQELFEHTVLIYELEVERIRLDSTTTYGYHQVSEDGMMQLGHSKDHRPDLPQLKLMAAAAEPSGHWLGSEAYSGERSDNGLYIPMIARVQSVLGKKPSQPQKGLLYMGDSKMADLSTRAYVVSQENHYLMPLPLTHESSGTIESWIAAVVEGEQPATLIYNGEDLVGAGYELERSLSAEVNAEEMKWKERVAVVRSLPLAERQHQSLEQRIKKAEEALRKLTPGKGKRPYEDETTFREAIAKVLKKYQVEGLLTIDWEKQESIQERFVGQGRPGSNSQKTTETIIRYSVRQALRNEEAIEKRRHYHGWQILVYNIPKEQLTFQESVLAYRGGWCLERGYHLLKDKPLGIRPLYVRNDDQIRGLTYLLTIALRLLTLIEIQVRQGIAQSKQPLARLYPGLPNKVTEHPTAPLLLKAISRTEITLTRINLGNTFQWHLTPLSELVKQVLEHLKLPTTIYTRLIENST